MTSVKVGRANEAFEASEEDDEVDSRYGKFSLYILTRKYPFRGYILGVLKVL